MRYEVRPAGAEVLRFVTTPESYTIYVEPALRLDVARCQHLQPELPNLGDDYYAYLWVQAVQGFYVFRQAVVEGRPGAWECVVELIPEEFAASFYAYIEENFFNFLPAWLELAGLQEGPESSLDKDA